MFFFPRSSRYRIPNLSKGVHPFLFIGGFDSSALCRSRRELSNEYLLANVCFDFLFNEKNASIQPRTSPNKFVSSSSRSFNFSRALPPRIGYQYFGHQSSGGYGQWPKTDLSESSMCREYDPRFRPWYTGAATGPKDVVLVLDKSGSMATANRITLAKDAALSVLWVANN